MKNLRKTIAVLLALCLLLTSVMPAFAVIVTTNGTPVLGYRVYHDIRNWGVIKNAVMTKFNIKGKTAFCIEAGGAVRGAGGETWNPDGDSLKVDYIIREITKDDSVQSKVAYLGYCSKDNPTTRDYAFTQMMIWQISPEWYANGINSATGEYRSYFVDKTVRSEYETWKKKIQKKIDTWSTKPDFNGKSVDVKAGKTVDLKDENGVLEDYKPFSYTKNGVSVRHSAGSNLLTVSVSEDCRNESVIMNSYELSKAGALKHDSKASVNYVYESPDSQDIVVYGNAGEPLGLSLSFNIEIVKGRIAIEKTKSPDAASDETLPEEGAEFQVYLKSAGSYAASPDGYRDVLTTDKAGKAVTKELPHGTYIVRQTKGAEGHKPAEAFEVVIGTGSHDRVYTYKVNNETLKSRIKILKKDAETGKIIPIAGVEFEITNLTTGEKIKSPAANGNFATDGKGVIELEFPLYYGQYRLKEKKAPADYVLAGPLEFTADGTPEIVVEVKDAPQKGVIKINKRGEALKSWRQNEDNTYTPVFADKAVAKAEFEITAAEDITTGDKTTRLKKGEKAADVVTGSDGTAKSPELYLGKYIVKETKAGEGYLLDDREYTVEIKYAGQEIELTQATLSLSNERQKAEITLEKTLEADKLFGYDGKAGRVRFGLFAGEEIKAEDGTAIPKDGMIEEIKVKKSLFSNTYKGKFSTDLPFGKFYVKETATDIGYVLDDKEYPVDFEYGGQALKTVKITVNNGEAISNNIIRGDIEGFKTDQNGEPLKGAVIGLFLPHETEFTEKNAVITDISDERGRFSFENVAYGDFLVAEIKQPEGFLLTEETFEVTVSNDGETIEIEMVNETVPDITTILSFEDGNKNHIAGDEITAIDKIKYEGLYAGHPYTFKGALIDVFSGKAVSEAEISFIPEKSSGSTELKYNFNAEGYEETGGIFAAVGNLYRSDRTGGKKVAEHSDIKDREQTVAVPRVKTYASDSIDGEKMMFPGKKATIKDTVEYFNLMPGREYTLKGTLMIKGEDCPLTDEKGVVISAEKTFSAEEENGAEEISFTFDASLLDGKSITVFESIYENNKLIARHNDMSDENQTVRFPSLITNAAWDSGKKETDKENTMILKDDVTYSNLAVGKVYAVRGILIDKKTGEPFKGRDGKKAAAEKTFSADKPNGTLEMEFNISGDDIKEDTELVVFEELYMGDKLIGSHKDISDDAQTVKAVAPRNTKTGDDSDVKGYAFIAFLAMASAFVSGLKLRRKE